jgi:hypothetical protein
MSTLKASPGEWKAFPKPIIQYSYGKANVRGHDPDRWVLKSEIDHPSGNVSTTALHFAEIHRCGQMSDEELRANAHLIAAAPCMAGALEEAKSALIKIRECSIVGASEGYSKPELWGEALYKSHGDVEAALRKIDTALARARGETSK